MNKRINSVLVLGLGKVGYLVGLLLHETGFKVVGGDANPVASLPFATKKIDATSRVDLGNALRGHDAVISCLPYNFNLGVARLAARNGIHYFDLTEDVTTTREIKELSRSASCLWFKFMRCPAINDL
jgi:saccharopine dehydrogenase-like NADP-dependent oxidoreductase